MGNCNCIDDSQNNQEIKSNVKSKSNQKYAFKSGSTNVYESTNYKSYNNNDEDEEPEKFFLMDYQGKREKEEKPFEYDIKVSRAANVTPKPKQKEIKQEKITEEEEFDYSKLAKDMYNIYNKMRLNPSNYTSRLNLNKSKFNIINIF